MRAMASSVQCMPQHKITSRDFLLFTNSAKDIIFDFVFEPIISAGRQNLSQHYAILIASPYLDGAGTALKTLDDFLVSSGSTAFILILTDQHNCKAPSSFIKSITKHKPKNPWQSIYGIIVDSGTAVRDLSMHSKLYVSYRYAPRKQSVAKLLENDNESVKSTLVAAVRSGGKVIDDMHAFYQPISASMGSANFTKNAFCSSDQKEMMIRGDSEHFVTPCRLVFADLLAAYPTPAFYGFGC